MAVSDLNVFKVLLNCDIKYNNTLNTIVGTMIIFNIRMLNISSYQLYIYGYVYILL